MPLGVPTLKSIKVNLRKFSSVMVPTGLARVVCGHPRQATNMAPLQSDNFFRPRTGLANFLRANAQIADNFRRNSRAHGDFEKQIRSRSLPSLLLMYCNSCIYVTVIGSWGSAIRRKTDKQLWLLLLHI